MENRCSDVSWACYRHFRIYIDVSFFLSQGTSCAIVGTSTSGKTSLCSLIARFWDVKSGEILLGKPQATKKEMRDSYILAVNTE